MGQKEGDRKKKEATCRPARIAVNNRVQALRSLSCKGQRTYVGPAYRYAQPGMA